MKIKIFVMIILIVLCALHGNATIEESAIISASLINQDPDPAIAGDVVDVRLGIQNIGGKETKNLIVEFMPQYPFTIASGENPIQKLGTINAYQGSSDSLTLKIIKYTIKVDKDASAGSYELRVRYYEEGSGAYVDKSLTLTVKNSESAEVIHIDKTNLLPGKQSPITFRINNVGNSPLRDLTFYFENTENIILPVGSDNTRYIKYIDVGNSSEIQYQVIADSTAVAGLYKLNLYLSYYDSSNRSTHKISSIAGVYVGGATDFDIAFSEASNSQTSFTIANIGANPANSVSIIVPEQKSWAVNGPNTVIIGNLNKGDYTVASFKLQARGQTAFNGSRRELGNTTQEPLKIDVAYTDTMGERVLISKEIKLSPAMLSTNSTAISFNRTSIQTQKWYKNSYTYIVVLILLAVGIYYFRKHKKRIK